MSFGATPGRQLYWDIESNSLDNKNGRVAIRLKNGLEYRFDLSYVLEKMPPTPYEYAKTETCDSNARWAARALYWPGDEHEEGHFGIVRVYDRTAHVNYWFSAETILMRAEPAYEDFAGERYPEYCPGYSEYIAAALRKNPDCVDIVVSPYRLKSRCFFHVSQIKLYRRPGILLFFTRGGDQYGIRILEHPEARSLLSCLGLERFRRLRGAKHRGYCIASKDLSELEQSQINDYVERLAFRLDYRFRGHRGDYCLNVPWRVRPAELLLDDEYAWPSTCTWEYH
jgi:hypothetical protein